jgi:rhomboid protease GluP
MDDVWIAQSNTQRDRLPAMAVASKICAECGGLNSRDAETCHRCGSRFPGAMSATVSGLATRAFGRELPMTTFFVVLCSLVFALITLDSGIPSLLSNEHDWTMLRWGAVLPLLVPHEPWRILSATFVHFGALHIVFNMGALIDLGKLLERQLRSARFCVLFVSTALSGFVASHIWYGYVAKVNVMTGGASGAIFGLAGALIGMLYARRDPAWKHVALRFGLYTALFCVMLPVNNAAHAGGFVLGLPLGYLFQKERRPAKRERVFRVLAALCIVASIASVVLCNNSRFWRASRALEHSRQ